MKYFPVCIVVVSILCCFSSAQRAAADSLCGTRYEQSKLFNPDLLNDGGDDSYQILKTDSKGNLFAVWRREVDAGFLYRPYSYILFQRSIDQGATWEEIKWLSCGSADCYSYAGKPRAATDNNGRWVVAWTDQYSGGGTAGDIIISRSTDNGITWSNPKRINTPAASDSFQFAVDAVEYGRYAWIVSGSVWNAGAGGYSIYYYRSLDAGVTWSGPYSIDNNAGFGVKLATDRLGKWVAGWSTECGCYGDDYIMTSSSSDDGQTWTAAKQQGFHDFALPQLDDLKYSPLNGYWVMVWSSDKNLEDPTGLRVTSKIVYSVSTNAGGTWSPAAWLYGSATDTMDDGWPRLYMGIKGDLAIAWSRSNYNANLWYVYQACSGDGGGSWFAARDINQFMKPNNVKIENVPAVAIAPDGKNIYALWSARKDANGAASSEENLFFSHGVVVDAGGVCNTGAMSLLLRKK